MSKVDAWRVQSAEGPAVRLSIRCLLAVLLLVATRPPALAQCDAFKRVFVTSTIYDGNLGGLAGADAKCAARAAAAGLSGTYKAWLSSSTTSAASRLTHATVPYKRTDGVTIANNWTDLTDGAIAEPISRDEFGHVLSSAGSVWTGTADDGSSKGSFGTNDFCCDWTCNVSTRSAVVGFTSPDLSGPWSGWTWSCLDQGCPNGPATQGCSVPSTWLYCFQQ